MRKALIRTIIFLIFVVLVGTPLFYLRQGVFPFILSKMMFFQGAVEILFGFWLILAISDKRYRPKKTPLFFALLLFLVVLAITTFAGLDPWRSFWSSYERAFGFFAILHLAAFAIVVSSLKNNLPWKTIFYASLITTLIIDILASIQLRVANLLLEEPLGRTGATFGNPTFLAGYLLFNVFLGIYLFLDKRRQDAQFAANPDINFMRKNNFKNIFNIFSDFFPITVSIFSSFVLIFLTETRGDMLGLAIALFVLLAALAKKTPKINGLLGKRLFYVILVSSVVVFAGFFWFTRGHAFWEGVPGLNRFRNVSFSFESDDLRPRLIAMRAAWRGFLDRPFLGIGLENFNIAFNKYYDPSALRVSYQETRFDKPHNFLLEDLVSGGIVLAFVHLTLFFLIIWEALRMRDKLFGQIAFAVVLGYFARSLFIFDTIGPALMLYFFMGFIDGSVASEKEISEQTAIKKSDSVSALRVNPYVAIGIMIPMLAGVYFINVRTIEASSSHFLGFVYIAKGKMEQGINNFKSALDIWSPYRWNFIRDFAGVMAETYFYNPDIIPKSVVLESLKEMENVRDEHPLDAYNHYFLVDMYNQISDIDPQKFLSNAEKEAAMALRLSPNRQQIYFSLAKTKTIEGDYKAALQLAQKALELDDRVADSHFYYGLLSYAVNDTETGYRELKKAMAIGHKWKNFYEPRTVANFFADSGHPQEAISLYQTALGMQDDLETKIKLGVLYYFTGDIGSARKYLEDAGKNFDFGQSLNYRELKPILDNLNIKS